MAGTWRRRLGQEMAVMIRAQTFKGVVPAAFILLLLVVALVLQGCALSPRYPWSRRPTVGEIQAVLPNVKPGMTEQEVMKMLGLNPCPYGLLISKGFGWETWMYDLAGNEAPQHTLVLDFSWSDIDKPRRLVKAEIREDVRGTGKATSVPDVQNRLRDTKLHLYVATRDAYFNVVDILAYMAHETKCSLSFRVMNPNERGKSPSEPSGLDGLDGIATITNREDHICIRFNVAGVSALDTLNFVTRKTGLAWHVNDSGVVIEIPSSPAYAGMRRDADKFLTQKESPPADNPVEIRIEDWK
ncbi:MAG: hypothetical protein AAB393_09385 [Bacteroidota bacterium]